MSEKEVLMSLDGLKKMEDELQFLKSVRRKDVAARIKQAIEFGDISENSEYEDAKNEQAFIEGNILALEKKLRNARVIDSSEININKVSVGCLVKVLNLSTQKESSYSIVGSVDADPSQGKISNESPVGKALTGRAAGEKVLVNIPAGTVNLKILEISK
ncbi:MAG: transcription elongation factor GreA [Clostridiales bacterium]|nr:transcription elongation factor GreA [Clostridiales bacterium]